MGKNVTKKKKAEQPRRTMRARTMALLLVVGIGAMAGMAAFNASAKPNRNMKWYVEDGAVQIAAPALGEGYDTTAVTADGAFAAAQDGGLQLGVVTAPRESAPVENPAFDATEPPAETEAPIVTEAPVETEAPAAEATAEPEPEQPSGQVTLTITAAGDCTFGGEEGAKGRRHFLQCVQNFGYDYFFNNVHHIFEEDDLTIVNLEGPLTTNPKPGKSGGFIFKGDPDYVNILTGSSVELCNLANNHILDYGKTGLKETAEVLDANGVGYCGYKQAWYSEIKGVRVCALGFDWWNTEKDDIAKAVAYVRPNCDLLIVNMHWGWEGHHDYDWKQQLIGHAVIDAGADLVIGTHPHVYQGIEKYKGKYIVYSLGNFCFAGNANPSDKRCLIFQQTFSFNPGMGIAQANILDQGINLIPCTVSSERDINDFRPTIMSAKEGASLLKSVASRSTNFTAENVRWIKDNYMLTYGLIKPEEEPDANAMLADVEAEDDAVVDDAREDAEQREAQSDPGPDDGSVT